MPLQYRIEYTDDNGNMIAFDVVTVDSRAHAIKKAEARMVVISKRREGITGFRVKQLVRSCDP